VEFEAIGVVVVRSKNNDSRQTDGCICTYTDNNNSKAERRRAEIKEIYYIKKGKVESHRSPVLPRMTTIERCLGHILLN